MIYLDNAATSNHKPRCVKKAVANALTHPVNVGRNSSKDSFRYAEKIHSAREEVAKLLHSNSPERIIFTSNASHALNLAIKGYCKENDHVITTQTEHNSVLRQLFGGKHYHTTLLPCHDLTVNAKPLSDLISYHTRLIVVNVASNVTGKIIDYRAIYQTAKNAGIAVLFDLSQAIGNLSFDVSEFPDCMVAFSGHKSLLGPQGTGVLYVSPEVKLQPVLEGGTGSWSNDLKQPDFLPDQMEIGTLNTPGILGLGEGVRFVNRKTPERLLTHKLNRIRQAYEELSKMKNVTLYHDGDFSSSVGILSFNISDLHSEEVARILSENYHISTRGGYHCAPLIHRSLRTQAQGTVRISPGYKTTEKEIDQLIRAVYHIQKQYVPS